MPRTRSLAWSELKIGVITIGAIAIAATTIFMLTGTKGFAWQRYPLKAQFTNVAGLKPGSPVRVAGVEVGTVEKVALAGEKVDVDFDVRKDMRSRITSESTATLGSVSLLGESSVDISPSLKGTSIPDNGYVPTGKPAPVLSDVAGQASQGIEELTGLLHDVREGKGTVGKLMTDERLYNELQAFVTSANSVADGIRHGRGTLGQLVSDPKIARELEASLSNVEVLTRQINSGQGSIGKLLKDDSFERSLTGATTNLQELAGKINRGEGTAGKLVTDATLYNRVNSISTRFDELVAHLNEGQGTAGQLLKDKQLYENMNGAVSDLRLLIADIRKDPRKFLNVKVSVF